MKIPQVLIVILFMLLPMGLTDSTQSFTIYMPLFLDSQPRRLDLTNDDISIITVDAYFNFCRYGPTQRFVNFGDQRAAMVIRFSETDPTFNPTITIHLFDTAQSAQSVSWWINNQHSDGIIPDAPSPIYTFTFTQANFEIASSEFIDHTVGLFGDEYDNYRVSYSINDVIDEGYFQLAGFEDETIVHIRTKMCGTNALS